MITYLKREKPKNRPNNCFAILINDEEFDDHYILNIIYNKRTLAITNFSINVVDKNYKDALLHNDYDIINEYEILFNSFYQGLINAVLIKCKTKPSYNFFKEIIKKYKINTGVG